ncbi:MULTISPECIES: transposase [unclassified Shewanella]|uniref:transposase n=1 Tax=unclassified Shewanella TaxID=196818 RepID=UPI001BBB7176|nr:MULTISPECIES: transposase [unclassified Shewanella]GIU20350.1 transposase [Shewanella sp. MBTL60-112-B1]GIU39428.1 transposase [Shewanella sp. MBTL60-112-B2]
MPTPRKALVSLEDTPFYHCISRCVRKAFLCGVDKHTGQSYEHRRDWVELRLLQLAKVFAIDICAFAVMSNHLHLVLRVDAELAKSWSDIEVVTQWQQLFKGDSLNLAFIKGESLESYQQAIINKRVKEYRIRLMDISWFMRALNEPIARKANAEDKCKGRFWEGRFKSQALLDETAVLACMAYVDLNPIRAKMAVSPETSDFTSIQLRIKAAVNGKQPKALLHFVGNEHQDMPKGLMFNAKDYLQLIDDTGRIQRHDKRGAISLSSQKLLHRLNIPAENWLKMTAEFTKIFKGPVGNTQELTSYCEHLERKRRQGAANCHRWLDCS